MKWRPIETAPKTGEYILVWPGRWTGCTVSIAAWDANAYAKRPRPYWRRLDAIGTTDSREWPPTHWLPMPEGPK